MSEPRRRGPKTSAAKVNEFQKSAMIKTLLDQRNDAVKAIKTHTEAMTKWLNEEMVKQNSLTNQISILTQELNKERMATQQTKINIGGALKSLSDVIDIDLTSLIIESGSIRHCPKQEKIMEKQLRIYTELQKMKTQMYYLIPNETIHMQPKDAISMQEPNQPTFEAQAEINDRKTLQQQQVAKQQNELQHHELYVQQQQQQNELQNQQLYEQQQHQQQNKLQHYEQQQLAKHQNELHQQQHYEQQQQDAKDENEQAVSELSEIERLYKLNSENPPEIKGLQVKLYESQHQQHHEQHLQQEQQQNQHEQHHLNCTRTFEDMTNAKKNDAISENKTNVSELDEIEATAFRIENWDELFKSCFD
jgi:hypothetical protein